MRIVRYSAKRILILIPTLFILGTVTFLITHVLPGDPVALAAGEGAPRETIERLRRDFGLDQPLPVQYVRFWSNLFQGDFGDSLMTRRPVRGDLERFLPATLELALVAFIIAVVGGITTGVLSAVHRGSLFDHVLRIFSISGIAMPLFWFAILIQILVANLGLLPISGRVSPQVGAPEHVTGLYLLDSVLTGNGNAFISSLKHIILPALALAFPIIGLSQRMTRAMMLEALEEDYIENAYGAAGLPKAFVQFRYALRNAVIPVITQLALNFGHLLTGSILVETVFNWPGLGLYIVQAANFSDFQPIVAGVLISGVVFIFVSLVADILYSVVDPRIELR